MDVVRVMGKEGREWVDKSTGELKSYCGFHVVYELTDDDSVEGKKCESISCPKGVKPADIKIGETYEIKWVHFSTKTGTGARISGLVPFDLKA